MAASPNDQYLSETLRNADYDRFLLGLCAPRKVRAPLWALYLFDHEIARTRLVVSETTLGHIRLQWWRDEIAELYRGGAGGQSPVLSTLAPIIRSADIPLEWFESLIYAREFELEDVRPASLDHLFTYAGLINTPLHRIAMKILAQIDDIETIEKISRANGMIRILRAVALSEAHGLFLLPESAGTGKQQVGEKMSYLNNKADVVQAICERIDREAKCHKVESRYLRRLRKMTRIHLSQLSNIDMNVFDPRFQLPAPFMALRTAFIL